MPKTPWNEEKTKNRRAKINIKSPSHETTSLYPVVGPVALRRLRHHRASRRTAVEWFAAQSHRPHAGGRQCRSHLPHRGVRLRRRWTMLCAANAQASRRRAFAPPRRRRLSRGCLVRPAFFERRSRASHLELRRVAKRCECPVRSSHFARRSVRHRGRKAQPGAFAAGARGDGSGVATDAVAERCDCRRH